jgi:hypothetical protein
MLHHYYFVTAKGTGETKMMDNHAKQVLHTKKNEALYVPMIPVTTIIQNS